MAQVQETVQTREGGQGAELGQSSPAEEEDGVAPGRGHCPLAERKILRAKAQQTWSRFNRGESGGLADVPVGRRSLPFEMLLDLEDRAYELLPHLGNPSSCQLPALRVSGLVPTCVGLRVLPHGGFADLC